MSRDELQKIDQELNRGLELAEYQMLRDKAMRNQNVIQSDGNGGVREVSARSVFQQLYNEAVPTF